MNQDQVNKKILARAPLTHPKKELLGPFGRFRNENYEIYLKKKEEFFTTVKSFKKNNELALVTNWNKLSKYSEDLLQFDFEQDVVCQKTQRKTFLIFNF